jgi:hypothetical protein
VTSALFPLAALHDNAASRSAATSRPAAATIPTGPRPRRPRGGGDGVAEGDDEGDGQRQPVIGKDHRRGHDDARRHGCRGEREGVQLEQNPRCRIPLDDGGVVAGPVRLALAQECCHHVSGARGEGRQAEPRC